MTPPAQPIEVAAGLLFRGGRLLITQRPAGAHLAGLWEFPGGKREQGETFEQCLRRELREELAVDVEVLELVESIDHDYAGKRVHLRFFRCAWKQHEPQAIGCQALRWVRPDELGAHDFPAADRRLLELLGSTPELWADR